MIKNVSAGAGLVVSGGQPFVAVGYSSAGLGIGNMRWNSMRNDVEVYDGATWAAFSNNSIHIGLSTDILDTLAWARLKMSEERHRADLAKHHPALKDLIDQATEVEDKIKMVSILLEQDTKSKQSA